jgi:hypothetical protein
MLKLTIKLDLPCGCSEEHSFDEGEIVYFIENEDKQLDKELFGFWLNTKIRNHTCIATYEDIEKYLLFMLPMLSKDPNVEQQHLINMLAEIFALKDGKRIPW